MPDYLYMLSIILNIILFFLLLFKSALNDILKEWWSDKRNAKKEYRDRLSMLRSNLTKLSGSLVMVLIAMALRRVETDPEILEMLESQYKNNLEIYKEINDLINKDYIHYPNNIRELINRFSQKTANDLVEVNKKQIHREFLLKLTGEINSDMKAIIEAVDSHLNLKI
jgi:hypothetical protein